MTDNFSLIKKYICLRENEYVHDPNDLSYTPERAFDKNEDRYYVIELMRRGKDNPGMPAANMHFKNYYINKVSDLDKYKDDIIKLCNIFNMRAYFSVNWKSYKQVLMDTTAECARRVATHDYKKPYSIYESCSGKFCSDGNKTWIIDVDKEDAEQYNMTIDELVSTYINIIKDYCKPYRHIISVMPTRSGKHIICKPFDVSAFNECLENLNMIPHSDSNHQIIKKNHLTLLYENI